MSRKVQSSVEDYPSLLWIVIPPALLITGYFVRKWYLARRLKLHGIGKGAPGFQTGVRRVRVTADVAARIQRGEDVSPDEIAESISRAQKEDEAKESGASSPQPSKAASPSPPPASDSANEWLPESLTSGKKQAKRRRK